MKEKALQEAVVRMERVRDEDKSGKKSKGRWSEGGASRQRSEEPGFVWRGLR